MIVGGKIANRQNLMDKDGPSPANTAASPSSVRRPTK
jgi:hypothetical protein